MNKLGIVTATHSNTAVIRLACHSACSECGGCNHGGDGESKEMLVEALNEAGAVVGDQVQVDLESVQVVRAAFIFYVIPLVALLVGVFAAKILLDRMGFTAQSDMGAAVAGTLLMILAFMGIRVNEGRMKKSGRYLSRVVEICKTDRGSIN